VNNGKRARTTEASVEGQEVATLAQEPFGNPMFDFLSAFAGRTNRIPRNIIAERGLGMPQV
jgi:hypothetical protein